MRSILYVLGDEFKLHLTGLHMYVEDKFMNFTFSMRYESIHTHTMLAQRNLGCSNKYPIPCNLRFNQISTINDRL